MSNEVDLKLVADSKPYVDSVRNAMNANQQLYAQVKQNAENEKKIIADINAAIYQYTQEKKKATNPKDQERYNAKIAEAKLHLNEAKVNAEKYAKEQKKLGQELQNSEKKQGIFSSGLAKLVGVVGGAVGSWNLFKKIMAETQTTGDAFANTMAGVSESVSSLFRTIAAGDWSNLLDNITRGFQAGFEYSVAMDEIADRTRAVNLRRIQAQGQLQEQLLIMTETETRSYDERVKAAEEYQRINNDLLASQMDIADKQVEAESQRIQKLLKLSDSEVERFKQYVTDYDKLSDDVLNTVLKIKEGEAELTELNNRILEPSTTVTRGGNIIVTKTKEQQDALIERANFLKQYIADTTNALSAEERKWLELDPKIQQFIDKNRDALASALTMQANANNMHVANERMVARRLNSMAKEQAAKKKQENDARLAEVKKLGDEILKLEDENEKKRIERLTGSERFAAEEQYQLNQIAKTKAYLETLGTLDANALRTIATMEQNVRDERKQKEIDFQQEILEINQSEAEKQVQIAQEKADELKAIDDNIADYQRQVELSMADFVDKTGLQRMIVTRNHKQAEVDALKELYLEQVMSADEASKKLAQITMAQIELGNNEVQSLDEQIRKKKQYIGQYAQAFQTAFNTVTSMLQSTYNAQLQFFQRERQMMDTRIGELQRTIDQEIEARDKGYANNVEGKKRELEQLQAERDKAFEKERKVAEAQRKLNEVIQVSNLITASAQIFNTYSLIPGGTILAISLIALMLGAYIKAKVDAKKYASLGEGGSGNKTGIITGKKHSQGGENFLDHVEVESGETWGVLAANKASKYGTQFHSIVKAMNEGKFEMRPHFKLPQSNNTVIVNNENKRMQSLENAMRDVERAIKDQPQIYYSGGKRIERKGRNTRIIYENN